MPKGTADRQKNPAEGQKPEHRAEDGRKEHENSVLPLPDIQCQKEIADEDDEAEAQIEQVRQPSCTAAQTTQEIINQPVARPEHDGGKKLSALKRQR